MAPCLAWRHMVAWRSNENKMSDGGRGRASLGMKVWKSSKKRSDGGPPFAPSHG